MQIIISHVNTDFDALASMFAAKKLYPDAQIVLTDKQNIPVSQFLAIYREALDFVQDHTIDWSEVTELILVDEASLARTGDYARNLNLDQVHLTVYDHHPPKESDETKDAGIIAEVGAAVTLLVEKIKEQALSISSFEATLFGLGIYTDTGSFTYNHTTARDFQAASYLIEQGMDLELVQQFADETLLPEQQEIINHLFQHATVHYVDGLQIVVSTYEQKKFQKGLATFTQKLLEITDADAALVVVGMKKRIYIVGRARSDRITLQPLLHKWKGGGHAHAGSATIKHGDRSAIFEEIIDHLDLMIQPAMTARDMMTSPVKMITPDTSIEESGNLMYRYGHSGFPVVQDGKLQGLITRRDLEKANHHGLGHAPVKAYMSTNVVSISPETTEEEIRQIIIERNIGRLPVVENGEIIGIVSRTNIIETLHMHAGEPKQESAITHASSHNIQEKMARQLPEDIYHLLQSIAASADRSEVSVYVIGGIVRDILLHRHNDDIDIVVEGDGVAFSKQLQASYGGEVMIHESFGTATWTHPSGLEIDVTSSRLEYYERPAALPDVEMSTLEEDLSRRDFTINAMAICLNEATFGKLIDPFRGREDLQKKTIKILHNISFIEDPTRIFRAIRFEHRFQFTMDEQTENLALQSIDRVKELSTHRIMEEMKRMFTEGDPAPTIRRLFELQFWQQFGVDADEEANSYVCASQLQEWYKQHTCNEEKNWFVYFIIPFYVSRKLEDAKPFALRRKHKELIKELKDIPVPGAWRRVKTAGAFHRLLKDYSEDALVLAAGTASLFESTVFNEYIQKRQQLPTLLTGEDLMKEGLTPGPVFSKILLEIEVAFLNEEVRTKDEAKVWVQDYLNEEKE